MKAKLIKADGTVREIEPANGVSFELDEMYDLLGCEVIQIVESRINDNILIIDEEGKFKEGAELNILATTSARTMQCLADGDYIVGSAILCHTSMVE